MVSEKEIFLSFSHYKSMGAISRHGGHLHLQTVTIFTNFQSPFYTRLHINLALGFQRRSHSKVWSDGQMDEGWRVITIAHPEPLAQVSEKCQYF